MPKRPKFGSRSKSLSISPDQSNGYVRGLSPIDSRVSFHVGTPPGGENDFSSNGLPAPPSPSPSAATTPTPAAAAATEALGPVGCGHDEHPGFHVLDKVFDLPVDRLFEAAFTDSEMYQLFASARTMYDLDVEQWSTEADEDGNKGRILKFMLPLNYPIGPKATSCVETQTLQKESTPGELYVVDAYSITPDVPYGNSFGLLTRFCITRVNSRQTRVVVNSQIKYTGRVIGFMKSIIDKNVSHGTRAGYTMFGEHIAAEAERQQSSGGVVMRPKKTKNKKSKASTNSAATSVSAAAAASSSSQPSVHAARATRSVPPPREEGGGMTTIIGICLVVLLFVNALLYYKLRRLETRAAMLDEGHSLDWSDVVERQEAFQHAEMKQWKDLLWMSSQLLGQMKGQIDDLQESLDKRALFEHEQS